MARHRSCLVVSDCGVTYNGAASSGRSNVISKTGSVFISSHDGTPRMSSTGARSREASSDGGGDAGVDDVAPRGPFDELGLEHAATTTLNTQTALRAARIYSFRAFQI